MRIGANGGKSSPLLCSLCKIIPDILPNRMIFKPVRRPLIRSFSFLFAVTLIVGLALLPPGTSVARVGDGNPEAATGSQAKTLARATRWMAASANPLATEVGRQVLRDGGSAVDAAIAMQMVLALVEPQSSGLGGGAFVVTWDARHRSLATYDGRETAPAAASPALFLLDGKPLSFPDAVNSGLSVGVPGVLRALELAHRRHGRLAWARLLAPAIDLAERGFPVSARLHAQIDGNRQLFAQEAARAYFYPQGQAAPVGYLLKNPALAQVMRRIASEGVGAFYEGEVAEAIVNAVQRHPRPGHLSLEDMKHYRAKRRSPVCSDYRVYRICGMGPPSSGAIAVMQMLGMLRQHHLDDMLPGSPEAVHYFSEAGRLAFADRDRYVADPDLVSVPVKALLPGGPLRMLQRRGRGQAADRPSATQLVAVDREGNAVSMTSTIESEFGSKIFVRGFLLNNQLTDFALNPNDAEGKPVANRVEAGKRPRSSMAPLIVMREGRPFLLIGSPGGSSIINYVAKSLIGVLDWRLDVQQAIALPNMGSRNRDTELEQGTVLEVLQPDLRRRGHRVTIMPLPSGIQAIKITRDGMEGVAAGD